VIRKSKKARSRARMVKQLDAAARQEVFERDHFCCVRCNDPSRAVQWCHIFSRRHKNLRWNPDNALTMCAGDHMWWHQYPLLAVEWFRKTWPERYEAILSTFNSGGKVNIKELFQELQTASNGGAR
jgi:5-methylcytosine-specific restriction endonuclease McrA